MDYSASLHDADNPGGTSPWGSSPVPTPQNNRSFSQTFQSPPLDSPSMLGPEHTHARTESYGSEGGFTGATTEVDQASNGGYDSRPQTADSTATSQPEQHIPRYEVSEQGQVQQQQAQSYNENQHPQEQQRPQQQSRPVTRQGPQYKLVAKITGLERTGRKDPILRFDVHTNLPAFRTTQFRDVRRTHSEFVKLADHLVSSNPECIVPAVPPALTSAGAGTDEDEARVKAHMQRWLNVVCSNEVLMGDDEMVLFVESDFGYSPMVKRKQPATGVRRKVIKQFAPPPDECTELSEGRPVVKAFYLGTMDAGHKVDRLVKARKGLGLAESDFGIRITSLAPQESHPGLANAYRKLGKTTQTVGDFQAAQGTAEATTLGDPLQYHSEDAFIVKETLTNRHILMRELAKAEELSRKCVSNADRLKVSGSVRREKVDEAIGAMDEARSNELHLRAKTQRVTNTLVLESRRWFARTTEDMRMSLREYVLREIEAERRTLATLEAIRPDIRAVDASGGLSRLGREGHPVVRRVSVQQSQGPKGDAWSGVPRRGVEGRVDVGRGSGAGLMPGVAEDGEEVEGGRARGVSVPGKAEDDEDRIDARNAASRLATSTF